MFEHRLEPVVGMATFAYRVARHFSIATALVVLSLAFGVIGYRVTEGLSWLDALLNASMLLGGMGPAVELRTEAGKLFASFYALYCGLVFVISVGIIFAPVVHRLLHRFHVEADAEPARS
jgi:hypothetical protein